MPIRVLLVAHDPASRSRYEAALAELNVDVDTVASLGALHRQVLETPYSGFLLDLPTLVRAPEPEKTLVHDLLEIFPVARVRWDPEAGAVRALFYGQAAGDGGLREFIDKECRPFEPRSLRRFPRRAKHFNILLTPDGRKIRHPLRTTSLNISEGGCFVYDSGVLDEAERVRVHILELRDQASIQAQVRWRVPWGTPLRMTGIGLEFTGLDEDLHERLGALL